MQKATARRYFHFLQWWRKRPPVLRWNTFQSDDRGVTTALVALLLVGFLALVAWMFDVTGILIRTQELHTMADLSAAAAGRLVAEEIAGLATTNVENGLNKTPSIEEKDHPENFLTREQRIFVQTDSQFLALVREEARKYIAVNRAAAVESFDARNSIFYFPVSVNDCSDSENKYTIFRVALEYPYPYILGGVAELLHAPPNITLKASGYYRIKICP